MQLEDLFKKSDVTTDTTFSTKPKLRTHGFFKALQLRISRVFPCFFCFVFFFVLLRGYKTFLALSATQNKNWFMRQHAFREMKQFLIVLKVAQGLFRFCILRSVIGPQPFS